MCLETEANQKMFVLVEQQFYLVKKKKKNMAPP